MSRKKKILIIFHLCFALSYFFWLLIQPYVKEIVSQKSEKALYEMVMARETLFHSLSPEEQLVLTTGYETLQKRPSPSILHEMGRLFFVDTPPFALAWLFFSLLICFLLLFRIEGATKAIWLLPLIVLGYAYFLYSSPSPQRESLFPSEEYVLTNYIDENQTQGMDSREKLLRGWHLYLIHEWAHESPDQVKTLFDQQLDKGLFAFNVARLRWILDGKGDEIVMAGFTTPPSILRVACYFIWNFLFAWLINRREKASVSTPASNPSYSASP